jgi:hypothetical protein
VPAAIVSWPVAFFAAARSIADSAFFGSRSFVAGVVGVAGSAIDGGGASGVVHGSSPRPSCSLTSWTRSRISGRSRSALKVNPLWDTGVPSSTTRASKSTSSAKSGSGPIDSPSLWRR